MPIDFRDYERGTPFDGDGAAELAALQARLGSINLAQIIYGRRALVVFEGWSGSGRKQALRALSAALDPTHAKVSSFKREDLGLDQRHWFAPFWEILPSAGETRLSLGSWYSRALDLKFAGQADERHWLRMLDEINEFESQQRDHGTILVKLLFHVSEAVQKSRLAERLADPWERHLVDEGDLRRADQRAAYLPVMTEMFDASNTRWAPWSVIDAADPPTAQISALSLVAQSLAASVPSSPPSDSAEIVDLQARRRG